MLLFYNTEPERYHNKTQKNITYLKPQEQSGRNLLLQQQLLEQQQELRQEQQHPIQLIVRQALV